MRIKRQATPLSLNLFSENQYIHTYIHIIYSKYTLHNILCAVAFVPFKTRLSVRQIGVVSLSLSFSLYSNLLSHNKQYIRTYAEHIRMLVSTSVHECVRYVLHAYEYAVLVRVFVCIHAVCLNVLCWACIRTPSASGTESERDMKSM